MLKTGILALIRHGESEDNLRGVIQGQSDSPLSATGRGQAVQLAFVLRRYHFDFMYSSGLSRADCTAEIIADYSREKITLVIHPGLLERHWGVLQGRVGEDVRGERDRCISWETAPEGGESTQQVSDRAVAFFNEVVLPLLLEGRSVAIVSHSVPLAALARHISNGQDTSGLHFSNCEARIYHMKQPGQLVLKEVFA